MAITEKGYVEDDMNECREVKFEEVHATYSRICLEINRIGEIKFIYLTPTHLEIDYMWDEDLMN